MLGDRNLKDVILRTMDDIYRDLDSQIDKTNNRRINVKEIVTCLRKSYYDRKNPLLPSVKQKVSTIIGNGMRKAIKNGATAEYNIDSELSLVGHADTIVDDIVVKFEIVEKLPKTPDPKDLLGLNATMWIFEKIEGIIVYMTNAGKSVEFAFSKDKQMFEETVRRARVFNTLLKEEKTPILEPSEICQTCPYYERCYIQEKKYSNLTLERLLGFKKSA
jgi:CRISPR-associated exonuclease Cas4